jgi:hypothetical protein
MTKFALRVKRYFSPQRGRGRSFRPKTFKTEERAKAWAKEQGFENYTLENLKSPESKDKKIRVVVEI